MMKKLIKPLLIVIAIIAVAASLYGVFIFPHNSIDVSKGKINKVETMVELCSIDFYNEIPIKDTIANWEFFAKQKQRGSILFDIENLNLSNEGDTLKIVLPPEIVEIMESTDDDSWVSYDSKDLRTGRWAKASTELWSQVKKNALEHSKARLYEDGTIERARAEGALNLQELMEKVYRKPVLVTDPYPKGAHYDEFM